MIYYLFGAGGHAKVVLDAMLKLNLTCGGFVDISSKLDYCGLPVFNPSTLILSNSQETSAHIAIGSCKLREEVSTNNQDLSFSTICHPNSTISLSSSVLEGCFLASGSIIAPDSLIGRHCIINHNASVDHESIVGDFSHISPQVSLGGNVRVGRGVLIGAGATVLPGLVIGDYAVIGAGAVVTKHVKSYTIVSGSPAREMS